MDVVERAGREDGSILVEAAIAFPLLWLLVFQCIECIFLMYTSLTTQVITIEGARMAASATCGDPAGCTGVTRARAVEDFVLARARAYDITLQRAEICIRPQSNPDCSAGNDGGRARELFVVRIFHQASFLGLGTFTLRAEALGRNEPYTR